MSSPDGRSQSESHTPPSQAHGHAHGQAFGQVHGQADGHARSGHGVQPSSPGRADRPAAPRAGTPAISRVTAELLGLRGPMNIDAGTWQRVERVLINVGTIETVMGDAGFEMVVHDLDGPIGKPVRPSIRTLERVGVMSRLFKRDDAELYAIRAAIDASGARRLLALGEMTFAGLPSLAERLEEDQLCRYLAVGVRDQMRMMGFLAEVRAMVRAWTRGRAAA